MVDLTPRSTPRSTCLVLCCLKFAESSTGHKFFIRTPIFENSKSISCRIPRWTHWRNPFPLILILKINYTLISCFNMLLKFGLLHSPLLKGFRPRNLQVKKNVSYHPIIHLLNYQSQASIVLKKILMLYEHMQKVCVYVPYLMLMIRPDWSS